MDAPQQVEALDKFQAGDIVKCKISGYGWALKGEPMRVIKVRAATVGNLLWLAGNDRQPYAAVDFEFVSRGSADAAPLEVPYPGPERHPSAHHEDEALGSGHHLVSPLSGKTINEFVPPEKDPAIQPKHYTQFKIQPIRFGVENYGRGVLVTKVLKYMQRAPFKKGAQDMAKAADCLQMLTRFDAGDKDWWKGTVHFNG